MTQQLKIQRLKFRAGGSSMAVPLEVDTPNVTVLVGPNNAGKSATLREIESWCQGQRTESLLIDEIELVLPDTFDDLMAMLDEHLTDPPEGEIADPDRFWIARPAIREGEDRIHERWHRRELEDAHREMNEQHLRSMFVRLFTLRLDGRTRFDLVDPKPSGPLEQHPENHLWSLFVDDAKREKVRQFTAEAFGRHFIVDPSGMNQFRARLSDTKPGGPATERSLSAHALAFFKDAPLIPDLGDGVRCSVGLVAAIMCLSQRILLIDEPEAFLHPTLSRRVGQQLAETARERDASLVAATHSADFLFGCIQVAPDTRIVRLTYDSGEATARSIAPSEVLHLMRDPLLRSTNALRALFYRAVIATEADADRAFYDEVNYRLTQVGQGVDDALFLNAQNWQTIPRLVTPLRSMGIPAAAVFDFDVLMDKNFKCLWPILNESQGVLQTLQKNRDDVKKLMEGVGRKKCKSSGIGAFNGTDKRSIESFLSKMTDYGMYFLPVGELECWLPNLPVKRNDKGRWLTEIFDALGDDPDDVNYVKPGSDDVWSFIRQIAAWVVDPKCRGMPA